MAAYYNEHDPFAAAWLRNLIARGLIAPGEVDERSIVDVPAGDLRGFDQCHFFAGIGGWSYALRLAGWPDDCAAWTGSCPCQPFSSAGKQLGHADERHLWPAFHGLIAECSPAIVFGEQVASKIGREWLAGVRADLEADGYACGAADLCAAGVGAPHIRQRLFWVAGMVNTSSERRGEGRPEHGLRSGRPAAACAGSGCGMGHAESLGRRGRQDDEDGRRGQRASADTGAVGVAQGDADRSRFGEHSGSVAVPSQLASAERAGSRGELADATGSEPGCGELGFQPINRGRDWNASRKERSPFWADAEFRTGADGKARRVEPGLRILANGVSNRVGKLRGYGNAIVPQVAQAFIQAVMKARP